MSNKAHKSFFMPILCRFSSNDVVVKPCKVPGSSSTDPSSPKLSCIGQIKKRSTNTSNDNNNNYRAKSSSVHSESYIKLHKLFSSKNLITPAIDTISINNSTSKRVMHRRSKSCNSRGRTTPIESKKYYTSSTRDDHDIMRAVVAKELDPPLPVVKCSRRDQDLNVNLWKRRGFEMKSLQIQPIQVNMDRNSFSSNSEFSLPTLATTFS
ncbi:hypothetical protein Tco_1241665 [Tanacetum coccineum]